MTIREKSWQVAILGGGPAGCATALALRQRGLENVCICDPGRYSAPSIGETLPPDIHPVLRDLGLWDGFVDENHERCFGSCSSWGSDALGHNDFLLSPYGYGWHLDRSRFDAFLRRCVIASGQKFISGVRFGNCARDGKGRIRLRLDAFDGSSEILTAAFVVDATGSRSIFARRTGAKQVFLDRLTFVYGFFEASDGSSESRMTMLEAEQEGWWYAASLPGHRVVVAFATDSHVVRNGLLSREDRWFARTLRTRHVAARLNGCRYISGSLAIRAASSFLLDHVVGTRWLAVGDAAASYDPLSSQGIQKALEDGVRGAEAIIATLASDASATSAYARASIARFEEYRSNRNYFYGLETRWAESPFWKRRRIRRDLQWRHPSKVRG